jgi:predicted PurR-regulated permease PerM
MTAGRGLKAGMIGNLLFLILLLYISRPLIVPLLYGFFLAVILYPFSKKMEMAGLRRGLAIFLCLIFVGILFSGLILILLYQYNLFKKDLPLLLEKLDPFLQQLSVWINEKTGISFEGRHGFAKNIIRYTGSDIGQLIRSGISGTFTALVNLFIIPIYAALILNYRKTLVEFLSSLAGPSHATQLNHVLTKTISIYSNYIKGMVIVYLVVGILNSIGLLALGIKYAVLFGMITAIMTIIPYFGIIISSLLPISMAWISNNSLYYPWVSYSFFQWCNTLKPILSFLM